MKLSEKLWCDLKSDSEKHSWLLMGMGVSTGVVCHAIQTDLANSYHVKMQVEKERDTYRDLCAELVNLTKAMFSTTNLVEHVKAKSKLDLCIEKSESILGEKNGTDN